jgi:hypothetical protein
MNYYVVFYKHYDGQIWEIAGDYSTLDWGDETPKPTDEEMISYWVNLKTDYFKEIMRQERNQLLKDCDYCALPDYPDRDKCSFYRQSLRESPLNWTIDTPFPQPPP